jgi:hypothetical protein
LAGRGSSRPGIGLGWLGSAESDRHAAWPEQECSTTLGRSQQAAARSAGAARQACVTGGAAASAVAAATQRPSAAMHSRRGNPWSCPTGTTRPLRRSRPCSSSCITPPLALFFVWTLRFACCAVVYRAGPNLLRAQEESPCPWTQVRRCGQL